MKGKYITNNIRLACLTRPMPKPDIHEEIRKTLEERERIMRELEKISRHAKMIDMYLERPQAA